MERNFGYQKAMSKLTGKKPALKSKTITVKTSEENPEPLDLIADAIIKCADGFEKIRSSKLTERAVILLIHDSTQGMVSKADIKRILLAGENLRKFLK